MAGTSATAVPPKCYKPPLTRTPALVIFLLLNLVLILLIEAAFHKLPGAAGNGVISNALGNMTSNGGGHSKRGLDEREPLPSAAAVFTMMPDFRPHSWRSLEVLPETYWGVPKFRRAIDSTGGIAAQWASVAVATDPPYLTASPAPSFSDLCKGENPPPWCGISLELPPTTSTADPCSLGDPPPWCIPKGRREFRDPTPQTPFVDLMTTSTLSPSPHATSVEAIQPEAQAAVTAAPMGGAISRRQIATRPALEPRGSRRYWTARIGTYFVGNYLPVITAILLNILWNLMATSIKAAEPFYQLADSRGATGAHSLNLRSTTSGVGLVAYQAIFKGHWTVFWSSVISLLLTLVVPLSSELLFLDTHALCVLEKPEVTHCHTKLRTSTAIGRITEGLLIVVAVLTLSLVSLMRNRWSGVFADPSSIAGLATLFQNEEVLDEFRRLDPQASEDELAKALSSKRYQLRYYQNPDGYNGYGFAPCRGGGQGGKEWAEVSTTNSNTEKGSGAVHPSRKPQAKRSLWLHPASIVAFTLSLIGVLIIITYYSLTGGESGFEKFMDSEGFGVSFMMTAIGMLVKTYWAKVEEESRILEPYRNLSHQNAQAKDSILINSRSGSVTALGFAIVRARYFLAFLAFNTILAEMLTVALSRVPFRGDSIFMGYKASLASSTAIISFMLATLIWVAVRSRQTVDLPRRPDTIAAVLMYLCGSGMLKDFQGLSTVDGRARDALLVKMGKRYTLERVVGPDGVERVGIDEDTWAIKG